MAIELLLWNVKNIEHSRLIFQKLSKSLHSDVRCMTRCTELVSLTGFCHITLTLTGAGKKFVMHFMKSQSNSFKPTMKVIQEELSSNQNYTARDFSLQFFPVQWGFKKTSKQLRPQEFSVGSMSPRGAYKGGRRVERSGGAPEKFSIFFKNQWKVLGNLYHNIS